MKNRIITTFIMSFLCITLFGQQQTTENGLESIVFIDKGICQSSVNIEMSFLNDVTFPTRIDKQLTKYVYGYDGSMRNATFLYAKKMLQNSQELRGQYNINWVFCMAYQPERFFSYIKLQTPYLYVGTNLTPIIRCGIFDLKKKKMLTISDIFTKQWLDEHKKLKKETGRIFIMSDLTIVLMNKPSAPSSFEALASGNRIISYWLKKYNLREIKDSLNPEFSELIDWDTAPISVEPHVYEDVKAQQKAEDLRNRILFEEKEIK